MHRAALRVICINLQCTLILNHYCTNISCVCVCEGFTSPEVVQVSNSSSSPGSTPRRRSADTTMSSRRKLSASKEPKLNVETLNEKNKTTSDSHLTSRNSDKEDSTPKTTIKMDTPSIEISNSSKKFTMETKLGDRTAQRSPSPLSQEKRTTSMTRQEAVSDIRRSRGLINGEAKVNGDDKVITTAKPPLVASKEPVVTSKPPTAKSYDSSGRDSKLNSLKNTSKDEHPAVADIKDAAKEQSAASPSSRRISQYRLSGSEALHIFHPTRRNLTARTGEYGDTITEHNDDSRTNSPAPPSKSPVPDKKPSNSLKRDNKLATVNVTEESPTQQHLPPPPKSPGVTSVTGTKRPGVVETKQNALLGKEEEMTEPPQPPKSPGATVTRRPGNVESKQKKMLALLGKEASVDTERPTEILRTTPVSMNSFYCIVSFLRYQNSTKFIILIDLSPQKN